MWNVWARAIGGAIQIIAPCLIVGLGANAVLPQPSVYVRTRVIQSTYDRSPERDPRVQIIFSNNGMGPLRPESFEWYDANGQIISNICDRIRACQKGTVDCHQTRWIYYGKPFESGAKLHLVTLRPRDPEDHDFHKLVIQDLSQLSAQVTYRYFQSLWGPRSTTRIPLVTQKSSVVPSPTVPVPCSPSADTD